MKIEENISRIAWNKLGTLLGNAANVPDALAGMISPDEAERERSYWQLDNHVVCQATLYEAAYYVVPVLIQMLTEKVGHGRERIYDLLIEIAIGYAPSSSVCRTEDGRTVPLRDGCLQQLNVGLPVFLRDMSDSNPRVSANARIWWSCCRSSRQTHSGRSDAELSIDGPADVLAIEPCPEIEPGRGRVITGTFTTARSPVLELGLSNGEVLEPTPPHRIFSETRDDWVAAQGFQVGESFRTKTREAVTLESVALKADKHRVYNLEVEDEHHYYVGETGVLVHNECVDSPSARAVHDQYVEEVLGDYLPEVTEKAIHPLGEGANSLGTRRYDAFDPATGMAFEGNTTPWEQVTPEKLQHKLEQVASDVMNLADPMNPVESVVWFGTEPLPTSGPASQLREALERAGIPYWVVRT